MWFSFTKWSFVIQLIRNPSCGSSDIRMLIGWEGQRSKRCILEEYSPENIKRLTCQAECGQRLGSWLLQLSVWGNCNRTYWVELSVSHVGIVTKRQYKSVVTITNQQAQDYFCQQMHCLLKHKMLQFVLKISFYMAPTCFGPSWTIIREHMMEPC